MQTQEVLRTIRWVKSRISDELEEFLFPKGPRDKQHEKVVWLIHECGRLATTLQQNRAVSEVLKAFGVQFLLDPAEAVRRLDWVLSHGGPRSQEDDRSQKQRWMIDKVSAAWHQMLASVIPLELLTTPAELRGEETPETILSLELRTRASEDTPVARLVKAVTLIEELYKHISRIYKSKGNGALSIVKIESGSEIRIDCKGLGEPIRHLKDFIIEAWHKFRHKRPEEVLEKNNALLDSLEVMEQIELRVQDNSLSREDAQQLRRMVITSVSGLFECGALIVEIPAIETVENANLIGSFMPKLLPAPKPKTIGAAKKKTPKRAGSKKHPRRVRPGRTNKGKGV